MRILAVEDELIFANALEIILDNLGYELIAIAKNSEEFLRFFVSTKPDLVLMDINIGGSMDGIELAEQVTASSFAVPVIFLTAFSDKNTFDRAKKVNPHAFLTKPIKEDDLQRSIELAFENFSKTPFAMNNGNRDYLLKDSFFVKQDGNLVKVHSKDIIYIESDDKYCTICTTQQNYLVRMSLKDIYEKLSPTAYIRIQKGIVINVNFIKDIRLKESNVLMENAKELPIGKNFRNDFLDKLNLLM